MCRVLMPLTIQKKVEHMSLSKEQLAVLSALAANDDLGHSVDDLLDTGLPATRVLSALRELVAMGLVQHFVCIAEEGIALLKQQEAA